MSRRRLDAELVRRGLVESRSRARQLIEEDLVTVGGAVADKPGRMVSAAEAVELLVVPRFVSRAGDKLAGALDAFAVDPAGRLCLDVGSSTGGFTDCLLQAGADGVIAVDVGRHQLHERLRDDDRVIVLEQTDIRQLDDTTLMRRTGGRRPSLAVVDVSFISLRLVLPAVFERVERPAEAVVLVKPQFEAGKAEADRGGGVIRDPHVWERVLHEVVAAVEGLGAGIMGVVTSSIRGAKGNVEFLLHLADPEIARPATAAADLIAAVVADAGGDA